MRAVLFDFDGVLVDSEPLHFRAMRECLRQEGIEIDEREYVTTYLAYDDREATRLAFEIHEVPHDHERVLAVADRKAHIFQKLLPEIPFFPGARELVEALSRQMPIAIASGALRQEIEAILDAAGLRAAFSAIVGAGDVARGKPNPDPYLSAMAMLSRLVPDLEPASCLVVEDSIAGVAAGLAAGMRVLGVAHSLSASHLNAAHHVVESLSGVTPDHLRRYFAA